MDLDQLQSVRDRERQTDRLQQLRDSFYEEAAAFVRDLRAERDETAAAADDPFDAPRVNRLTDRIRTAEQTLEAIYEKRVGKVVKAATFAAADLPAEAEGMTKEESELFETLVAEIETNRATVLGRLDEGGDGPTDVLNHAGADGASAPDSDDASADSLGAADVMGGEAESQERQPPPPEPTAADAGDGETQDGPPSATGDAESEGLVPESPIGEDDDESDVADDTAGTEAVASTDAPADDGQAPVDRELVRITDDVGPILGVDEREYDLSEDDVVTLPTENARPLVERGAAERLETEPDQ